MPAPSSSPTSSLSTPGETGAILEVRQLSFSYGERAALTDVTFDVFPREIFGLLGPNGGGKTTLFRLLTTLLPVPAGRITVCGLDPATDPAAVRNQLGITFQSPSLDGRLTVAENLKHQGHLYGLRGAALQQRIDRVTGWLGVTDRLSQRAETLSGGLKRRVEVAKSLLHQPRLLILDEPSTGLDPGARLDLMAALNRVRAEEGVTVLITTHLMDEAEHCDRLAILDRGRLVACDTPRSLRHSLGGSSVRITTARPDALAAQIRADFALVVQVPGNELRIEHAEPLQLLSQLVEKYPDQIDSIALARPTLEDVFIQRTGHLFQEPAESLPGR